MTARTFVPLVPFISSLNWTTMRSAAGWIPFQKSKDNIEAAAGGEAVCRGLMGCLYAVIP